MAGSCDVISSDDDDEGGGCGIQDGGCYFYDDEFDIVSGGSQSVCLSRPVLEDGNFRSGTIHNVIGVDDSLYNSFGRDNGNTTVVRLSYEPNFNCISQHPQHHHQLRQLNEQRERLPGRACDSSITSPGNGNENECIFGSVVSLDNHQSSGCWKRFRICLKSKTVHVVK